MTENYILPILSYKSAIRYEISRAFYWAHFKFLSLNWPQQISFDLNSKRCWWQLSSTIISWERGNNETFFSHSTACMWVLYAPKLENDWLHHLIIFRIQKWLKAIKVPFVFDLHQSDQRCGDNALPSTQPGFISKLFLYFYPLIGRQFRLRWARNKKKPCTRLK